MNQHDLKNLDEHAIKLKLLSKAWVIIIVLVLTMIVETIVSIIQCH